MSVKLFTLFFVFLSLQLSAQNFKIHKVQKGETLKDIAREYQMAPSDILKYNGDIQDPKHLVEGQSILIPTEETKQIPADSLKITGYVADYKYHTVGKNETVFSLSKKYHSKIESILKLNKIEGYNIKLGQILIIPIYEDPSNRVIDSLKYTYYTVKPKQGKWRVAYDHGITIDELERLNPEIKDNNLQVGQKLVIPKYRAIAPTEIRDESKYIYHEVVPHETLFGLSKKYFTTTDRILSLNPKLKDGLKVGMTLKFDRRQVENNKVDTNKYVYHEVQPKETMFSLSKQYHTTIDKIIELNPDVKKGLKTGMTLRFDKVDNKENVEEQKDNRYIYHEVQAHETLFSLAKKYHTTVDMIKELNPELTDGLKTGQIIKFNKVIEEFEPKIIDSTTVETEQIHYNLLDSINTNKVYKLAILLPFKLKKMDTLSGDNKCEKLTKNPILSYYSGIKLAIDSLKTYGMNVQYDVFDTQASAYVTGKILENTDLSDYDFVIGPIKKNNIDLVATRMELDNTPDVVHKYKGDKTFRNLIVTGSGNEGMENHIIHYLNDNASHKAISIIYDETRQSKIDTFSTRLNIKPVLIKGHKTKNGGFSIKIGEISKKLSKDKPNFVILDSDDDSFIFTVLSSLNSLSSKYKITLFTLTDKKLYEDDTNDRTNTFLANLNYHFPSRMIRLIDAGLKKSFENRYHFLPDFVAVNGFDSTFDLLLRAGNADNLFEGLQKIGMTKQTSKVFLYQHQPEKGFKNQASVILKMNKDLKLEVVE